MKNSTKNIVETKKKKKRNKLNEYIKLYRLI